MAELELLPTNYQLIYLIYPSPIDLLVCPKLLLKEVAFIILYYKKMGLVLYIATIIRLDITFIVL